MRKVLEESVREYASKLSSANANSYTEPT